MENKDAGNLISDLTDGKVKTVEFGGKVPELNFDPIEMIGHYKKYEDKELKAKFQADMEKNWKK